MTELPSARAISSPLRRLVQYCKPLVFSALVVAPVWYAVRRCREPEALPELTAHGYVDHADDDASRQKLRPYLARLHDKARAHLREAKATNPRGLDLLLQMLLHRVDYELLLESEQQVDSRSFEVAFSHRGGSRADDLKGLLLPGELTDIDRCAIAMSHVFEETTGSDVIQVVARPIVQRLGPEPILRLRWDIRPSDAPNMILAKGTVTLCVNDASGKPFEISEPFELSRAVDGSGSAGSVIDDLCRTIGGQIVGRLTGGNRASRL
jgi:hypothetical protein